MFNHFFTENIKQALMITSFVMVMMLIIEFINVFTKGSFSNKFKQNPFLQIIFASLLGAIPGCLGTYAVVSLFTHNVIGLGALTSAMIATSGDETFIMFSMFPATAIKLIIILFIIAVLVGLIINIFDKKKLKSLPEKKGFPVHYNTTNECLSVNFKSIYLNLKFITFKRAILLVSLGIFITGLIIGEFGNFHGQINISDNHAVHNAHENSTWVNATFLILSVTAFIISIMATNHFLEHHLWNHILKVHFLRIFLWTFGTLLFISFLTRFIDLPHWIESNKYLIFIIAILIGIIPVSGPHIIFITLFFNQVIPFSILMANSIVQDGHGALPLFAESKRSFVIVKSINILVGAVIGIIALMAGF